MNLAWGLGVGAAVCAVIAAFCAIKGTTIKPVTVAQMDPSQQPKNMEHYAFQLANALDAQQYFVGRWNLKAAVFGALAAALGLAAYFI
jgi:hypothetical protein